MKKNLRVKSEVVRKLSPVDLPNVVGGQPDWTRLKPSIDITRCHCPTVNSCP